MDVKPASPVDALTGRPLYFAPRGDLPPLPTDDVYDRQIANFHHPVHRRRLFEGHGPAGEAARDAGLQWASWDEHTAFHDTWGGMEIDATATHDELHDLALWGWAQYVPPRAIRFDSTTPRVDYLTRAERTRLRSEGTIIIGNGGQRVRSFFVDDAFTRGAPAIDARLVRKFLYLNGLETTSLARRLRLADCILQQAIEPTLTARQRSIFGHRKREQMFRPGLPLSLAKFVRDEIVRGYPNPHAFIGAIVDKCVEFNLAQEPELVPRARSLRLAVA